MATASLLAADIRSGLRSQSVRSVDGVLNTYCMEFADDDVLSYRDAPAPLSKSRLQRLAALVNRVDAQIVLSTTWRIDDAAHRVIRRALEDYGLGDRVRGVTSEERRVSATHGAARGRASEISAWLRREMATGSHDRPPRPWVALDDLHLEAQAADAMRGHAVKIDGSTGLQEADCDEACRLLARQTDRLAATLRPPRVWTGASDQEEDGWYTSEASQYSCPSTSL